MPYRDTLLRDTFRLSCGRVFTLYLCHDHLVTIRKDSIRYLRSRHTTFRFIHLTHQPPPKAQWGAVRDTRHDTVSDRTQPPDQDIYPFTATHASGAHATPAAPHAAFRRKSLVLASVIPVYQPSPWISLGVECVLGPVEMHKSHMKWSEVLIPLRCQGPQIQLSLTHSSMDVPTPLELSNLSSRMSATTAPVAGRTVEYMIGCFFSMTPILPPVTGTASTGMCPM